MIAKTEREILNEIICFAELFIQQNGKFEANSPKIIAICSGLGSSGYGTVQFQHCNRNEKHVRLSTKFLRRIQNSECIWCVWQSGRIIFVSYAFGIGSLCILRRSTDIRTRCPNTCSNFKCSFIQF